VLSSRRACLSEQAYSADGLAHQRIFEVPASSATLALSIWKIIDFDEGARLEAPSVGVFEPAPGTREAQAGVDSGSVPGS